MMKGGHGQTNQLHDINWSAPQPCISCTPINVKKYCVCGGGGGYINLCILIALTLCILETGL